MSRKDHCGTYPDLSPDEPGALPLALVLDQVLGRAGLRLVANPRRDPDLRPADLAARSARTRRRRRQADPEPAGRTPRVLLVDDNRPMRGPARAAEDAGMQVVAEAVQRPRGDRPGPGLLPDVVLMDWRMPELDGIQATARIRHQLPRIQVVMFSSAEGAGSGDLARQAGASAFVAKGARPEQLCAAVLAAWHDR